MSAGPRESSWTRRAAGRMRAALAGRDGPGRRALPAGEFLHPAPLAAAVVLAVNDHALKGGVAPGWLTGKLSDVAGLLLFPLLVTAVVDVALLAASRLGAPIDFSLRRCKLALACAATAGLFAALKLSAGAAHAAAALLSALGLPSAIVADPSDLAALPAVAVAYWLGRREIARVPLGRLEVIERAWRWSRARAPDSGSEARDAVDVEAALADVVACGGDPADVQALAQGFAAYLRDAGASGATGADVDEAEGALARLRGVG